MPFNGGSLRFWAVRAGRGRTKVVKAVELSNPERRLGPRSLFCHQKAVKREISATPMAITRNYHHMSVDTTTSIKSGIHYLSPVFGPMAAVLQAFIMDSQSPRYNFPCAL